MQHISVILIGFDMKMGKTIKRFITDHWNRQTSAFPPYRETNILDVSFGLGFNHRTIIKSNDPPSIEKIIGLVQGKLRINLNVEYRRFDKV